MKKRIVGMILTVVSMAMIGCSASVASTDSTSSKDMMCNNVYGIGVMQTVKDSVEVHQIKSRADFNRLTPIIENRNGRIVIEISSGTVMNDCGDGVDICGYYQRYDSERFSEGDQVQCVFVYGTGTNYFDDIVCRMDALIE